MGRGPRAASDTVAAGKPTDPAGWTQPQTHGNRTLRATLKAAPPRGPPPVQRESGFRHRRSGLHEEFSSRTTGQHDMAPGVNLHCAHKCGQFGRIPATVANDYRDWGRGLEQNLAQGAARPDANGQAAWQRPRRPCQQATQSDQATPPRSVPHFLQEGAARGRRTKQRLAVDPPTPATANRQAKPRVIAPRTPPLASRWRAGGAC